MKAVNECRHCSSPIPKGAEDAFCCKGCAIAWEMIHSIGLEDYYTRKAGIITSKVGNTAYISEEHFAECLSDEANGLKSAVFYVTSVRCAACVWLIENLVKKIDGVEDIRVNYATYRTQVHFDPNKVPLKYILEQIAGVGHPPVPKNPVLNSIEKKDLFLRFGVGAFFTMQLMLYSAALYAGYFQDMPDYFKKVMQYISWGLATPVMFYTGAPFIKNSLNSLKNHHLSMDVLVALGATSAYLYSIAAIFTGYEVYFDTCATILTLITLGRFIEVSSKQKAKSSMFSLFALTPPFARLVDGTVLPLERVLKSDRLHVYPGDRIPVDATVVTGYSSVDESMLTGEPVPKGKEAGAKVYAGTVNLDGELVISADSVGKDTVLSQIIAAVESADISKTTLMQTAERVIGIFVPLVILISLGTFAVRVVFINSPGIALMHAVAVLVVACPCALGLAVPLAVTNAVGSAVGAGAVIKNGDLLGALEKVDTICLDKTGTLTEGVPEVIKYVSTDENFLCYSASVEKYSTHILAKAISSYSDNYIKVTNINEKAGYGISGVVNGLTVAVGRYGYVVNAEGEDLPLYQQMQNDCSLGYSAVSVSIDGKFAGYYVLSDPLRDEAIDTVKRLSKKYKTVLLSGDSEAMFLNISKTLGVDYKAELSPIEKSEFIKECQAGNKKVLMAGDGINDAPALKQADASVAVGHNASDIAVDSADAVIIRPDLHILEVLLKLSRRTNRVVKENLAWAFSYNIVAVPLAATGIIHPIVSAVSMSVSSVLVVLNSMRAKVR